MFEAVLTSSGGNALVVDSSGSDSVRVNTPQVEEALLLAIHILTELPPLPNTSLGWYLKLLFVTLIKTMLQYIDLFYRLKYDLFFHVNINHYLSLFIDQIDHKTI
jgi:hypothetical protein